MQIKGKVKNILDMRSGQGQNGTWQSLDAVIELDGDGKYPELIVITFSGEKAVSAEKELREGLAITVDVNFKARNWQDKWFNSIQVWKYQIDQPISASAPVPQPQINAGPSQAQDDSNDLPF